MPTLKEQIKINFDKAASSYDQVATIQRKVASKLVKLLLIKTNKINDLNIRHILDVGTGTGYMAKLLLKYYPDSYYDLNDLSSSMLMQAKQNLTNTTNNLSNLLKLNFLLGDLEDLAIKKYDLICANLVLQWMQNLPQTIKKLATNSKVLAFSCVLQGTFQEWLERFGDLNQSFPINNYYTFQQLSDLLYSLQPASCLVTQVQYNLVFDNIWKFLRYIKALGVGAIPTFRSDPSNGLTRVLRTIDQSKIFKVSYRVFFGILII